MVGWNMLSASSIEQLAEVLLGDRPEYPTYRTASQLERLFETVGFGDTKSESESRRKYVVRMLLLCANCDSRKMQCIIGEALHLIHFRDAKISDIPTQKFKAEQSQTYAIELLLPHFEKDGYSLVKNDCGSYDIIHKSGVSASIISLSKLSHQFIKSHLDKAHRKLAEGDFDGAITSARTLAEAVQVELIKQSSHELQDFGGDLNKLFQQTKKILNLDPSKKDLADTIKQTLSGLNSVIVGIAGISNSMGDRHATRHQPKKHHAKLVVNATLTFCEFLVESHEYQKARKRP